MKKSIRKKIMLTTVGIVLAGTLVGFGTYKYINSARVSGSTITIPMKKDKLEVQLCDNNLVRVHYLPQGKSTANTLTIGTTNWKSVNAKINTSSNPMTIKTDKLTVEIDKKTYRVSIYDAKGNMLLKEQNIQDLYKDGVTFDHKSGQNFYGINGYNNNESVDGVLRNEGNIVEAGSQGHPGAPFVWTTSGYGVLVDSDGGTFNIDDKKVQFTDSSKKDVDYYVMVGSPENIMSSEAEVSGKPPMFPKWAMGFTNSEWGIDEKELINIVDTYRAKNIPIDNYTLDFDWKAWGEDNYGEFRWNDTKFPDGASGKLAAMMASKGIKLTGIMKPRIHVDTVQGKYLEDHKLWLDDKPAAPDYFSQKMAGDIDFSKPEARKWFADHAKPAAESGMQGWWNDEADEGSPNFQFLNMERALYDGQRSYTDRRVWSINRNFYLGAQRYAYGMWSGDIDTGFDSMKNQRDRMLSAVDLGEVKWGMDTGGFNGGDPSPQNYARWMEFSAFTPIFRVHGQQNLQRQPWVFGPTAEKAATKVIQLRYKLIPYIYSYERRAYENGIGLIKPLIYDYPTDKNVENDIDSWMFGDYMLVSPVVDEDQTSKDIYLPQGTWIDYFKGTKIEGGKTIKYDVNSKTWDDIPLFIKEGAIIPNSDLMNYVGEKPITNLYVDVFPSKDKTKFNYYDDDGSTYKYEKGEYFKQTISAQDKGGNTDINLSKVTGTFKPDTKFYIFKVHGNNAQKAAVGSDSLKPFNSLDSLIASGDEGMAVGQDIYGKVTYVKVKAGEEKNINIEQ